MSTYRATAERDHGWWIITVPEIDAVTQAKRIDQVEHMTRDLIAAWLDVDYDTVTVNVDIQLPEPVTDELDEARQLRAEASEKAAEASRLWSDAARRLYADGLPYRDVGAVLGVSFQRAKQLVDEATDRGVMAG